MTSAFKQNLRYLKASARLMKKVYPQDQTRKRLVKLNEQSEDLNKWVALIWERMYKNGFKPLADNASLYSTEF